MPAEDLSNLTVAQIMRDWPQTISVFIMFRMYCVGCPIGVFHTLEDAADEHGIALDELRAAIVQAIAQSPVTEDLALDRHL